MGRAFEYRRASKEKRWDNMSKLYPKLARAITLAAKEGGEDPEANGKLKAAIATAKAQNLPKDNIETAIKRASGRDAENISEANYEGKAAHGVLLWVECATDNPTRTVANVKNHFKKCGGEVVQSGALDFLFQRKTVIEFNIPEGTEADDIELGLIDGGLEEFEVNDDGKAYAYGSFESFGPLNAALEELGIEATKSSHQRIATSPIEITEEQMTEVEEIIDRLEDDDDVQSVYTNIA